jgi:polar amino acid transport system substrate-binding protein
MKKFILLISLFFIFINGCSDSVKNITSLADAADSKIGVMTGTTGEALAHKRFPQATVKSFDDVMDAIAALKSDQIDAVVTGFPAAMNVCKRNNDLTLLSEAVDYEGTAIAMRKGNEKLLKELNDFITALKNDGTLKDMRKRWFKADLSPYEIPDIKVPEKGEVIKIGVSATREPFCFIDENKKVTGHDGELARRVAAKLGRPIEFVDMKFSALVTSLQSGKIDLIISGMTATEERKKSVDFTESYFENSQVMLVKKRADDAASQKGKKLELKSIDDIKDKRIGVLLGSVHDTYAMKNYPKATVMQYKNPSELMLAVKSGKVDAAMYTHETLLEMLRTDSEIKQLGDTLFTIPIAMGFNQQNDALRDKFNQFLKKTKESGVFNDMVDRWIDNGKTEMPKIKNEKKNGVLLVGTVSDKGLPFTTVKDNKMIGFDIELAERFAAFLGKELKLVDMEFGSLIVAVSTNKIDMIASTLMITDERKKQIDFSDPYMRLGASVVALKSNIAEAKKGRLQKLDDIADKRIGVYAGTIHDGFVVKNYPKADLFRYNSTSDMILALRSEKVDAVFFALSSAKTIISTNPDIGILTDDVLNLPTGYGFNKNNNELRDKFNNFLKNAKSDGTFDAINKRWFVDDPNKAQMPKFNFNKNSKKITLAVATGDLPYSSLINNEYVGFDIELIETFAMREGFNLEIKTMDFSALVAALAAGKVDIIADGISITEERQKMVDFSDSYMDQRTAVVVLTKNMGSSGVPAAKEEVSKNSFLHTIADSFNNNIIVEKRYLLILDGLKTTAIISLLSIFFGTILGAVVCFTRMSKKKYLLVPAKIYISLLRGTPVLVILMIIFYVVFASVDIDPVIVAVIAFGMNFAAYVSEMFRTGIEGVERGQTEAGIAMGFTKVKTFIFIIAPQAIRRILPVYKGEVISLVKMTSIVGYIAVQDLTKASDIIRSRTFDAFFPLIMVAVLYFFISWLLMLALGYIERMFDPKTRIKRG